MFVGLVTAFGLRAEEPSRRELYAPTVWQRGGLNDRRVSTSWSIRVPASAVAATPLLVTTSATKAPSPQRQADTVAPMVRRTTFADSSQTQVQEPKTPELLQFKPPTREELFRMETDAALQRRLADEAAREVPPQTLVFPEEPVLPPDPGTAARLPALLRVVEPNYVCHGPLLFEEKNSEHSGWDLGPIQPFVSSGHFLAGTALLPWELMTAARRRYECSAGLFLPGTPIPYRWYLPSCFPQASPR